MAEAKLKVELAQRTVDEHLEKAASFREEAEGLSEKLNQQQEAIQPYVDGSADIDRRLREQKAMTSRIKVEMEGILMLLYYPYSHIQHVSSARS